MEVVAVAVSEENRRHQRYDVQVHAVVSSDRSTLKAITKDISKGGLCLVAGGEIPPGTGVTVSLALVLGKSSFSESLAIDGRVVWCTPLEGQKFQLGVIITHLTSQQAGYLSMFLRFLQHELVLQVPGEDNGESVEEDGQQE